MKDYRGRAARPLNERDIDGFLTAAARRDRPKPNPIKSAAIQELLRARNPWRWRRFRSDVTWIRKQLIKMGYDPEEIRWLL